MRERNGGLLLTLDMILLKQWFRKPKVRLGVRVSEVAAVQER